MFDREQTQTYPKQNWRIICLNGKFFLHFYSLRDENKVMFTPVLELTEDGEKGEEFRDNSYVSLTAVEAIH